MSQPGQDVTLLLEDLARGDDRAAGELLNVLYVELRSMAGRMFNGERRDHTLQPTALVHEAFIRLTNSGQVQAAGRAHFLALSAKVMRQILIDHARARRALKRSGGREVTLMQLDQTPAPDSMKEMDVLDLDDAMQALAKKYPRAAQVVELRYFGGMDIEQVASHLNIGHATVERDWTLARGWLNRHLTEGGGGASAGSGGGA